jgi:hypothetical protein
LVMEQAGMPRDLAAEAIAAVHQSGITETARGGGCGGCPGAG